MRASNNQERQNYRIWAASGQVERHKAPLLSAKLQNAIALFLSGVFIGFTLAAVIISQIGAR